MRNPNKDQTNDRNPSSQMDQGENDQARAQRGSEAAQAPVSYSGVNK